MNTEKAPIIAIIVPCFNEQEVLPSTNAILLEQLVGLIDSKKIDPESFILYVDDGSKDETWKLIESFTLVSQHIEGLKLAGNAGHQNALIAGLEAAEQNCDAAITIDADLQDDTLVIPEMIKKFKEGFDIVFGVRNNRKSDSWFKRESAQAYYRLLHKLGVRTIYNHADFRLMSSRAIHDFMEFRERNIFIRGIVTGLGYRHASIYYDRKPREAGESKYPLKKMVNFAVDGITSFSVRPVRMVFFLGVGFLLVAIGIFIYVLIRYFSGETIEGWTSLILSIWFCTGVILMSLGIIGEYIGKIYTEVKHRPRYAVEKSTKINKDSISSKI